MPKRVLSTSWHAAVLATRNLIIESAGYEVVTTRDPDHFLRLLRQQQFDAAVIGDSIPIEIRVALARRAKMLRPKVPLIVFSQNSSESQRLAAVDFVLEALGEPEEFVTALRLAVGDQEKDTGT